MGFFGSLFGGGGPKAYQDPNIKEEQEAAISGIRNQLGAKKRTNPAYSQAMQQYNAQLASYNQAASNPALGGRANSQGGARQYLQAPQMPTNIPQYTYDYSDVNKPIYGSFGSSGSTSQPRAATGAGRLVQSTRGAADTLRGKGKTQSDIYNVGQQSYDFSPINQALRQYQNPQDLTETYSSGYNPEAYKETYTSGYNPTKYNPYQFNFKDLPEQYYQTAYQAGAKDINRKGQENLTALAEKAGVRRPGMLFKAGEQAQRATDEQLASLRNPLLLEQMQQSNQNAIEQQRAQAAENQFAGQFGEGQAQFGAGEGFRRYQSLSDLERARNEQALQRAAEDYKGFQSRSDLEKANIDNRFRNAQALESGGQNRIVTQSNVLQQERDQQNTNLQYLLSLLQQSAGSQNQAAQIGAQKQGNMLGFLGGVAKGFV